PDVFHSVVLMSVPFGGTPQLPFDTTDHPQTGASNAFDDLAKLQPPKKFYQEYYRTREAADDMNNAPQGIHAFLRAYYHCKSADRKENKPFKLASFNARELLNIPSYYIMDADKGNCCVYALSNRDCRKQMADRRRAGRVCGRIQTNRI